MIAIRQKSLASRMLLMAPFLFGVMGMNFFVDPAKLFTEKYEKQLAGKRLMKN